MEDYLYNIELLKYKSLKNNIDEKIDTTKNDANKIIEVFNIIKKLVDKDNQSDINELINISFNFSEENKYQLLHYLIENWIYFASIYTKKFNLNTSDLHLNLFIEWIKKWWDNLIFSDYFDDFIGLYKDPLELKRNLWINWFFEVYDFFILEWDPVWKISKNNTKNAIKNYAKIHFDWDLLNKLNLYWIYDWDIILDNIFEDSNYAKKIFFDLFILNKKEKQDLKNMKVDFLNHNFTNDINDLISKRENDNMSLYSASEFDSKNKLDDILKIVKFKLNEIKILKNWFNKFLITFIDITWRVDNIEFTSKMNKLISNENTYENFNDFISKFEKILSSYLYLFNKNDFNFNILIFKSNWNKDFDDNEIKNNLFYMWKQLKSA